MSVMSEVERVFLPSQGRRINALIRDVGFLPIPCQICESNVKTGFAVIIPRCKHTFHHSCFMEALDKIQAHQQVATEAAVGQQTSWPLSPSGSPIGPLSSSGSTAEPLPSGFGVGPVSPSGSVAGPLSPSDFGSGLPSPTGSNSAFGSLCSPADAGCGSGLAASLAAAAGSHPASPTGAQLAGPMGVAAVGVQCQRSQLPPALCPKCGISLA
mmetsp:Transcript_87005/g.193553  ORF Transcript_87005/g.193553 Transcript_87005/m.193553 type:complete len:212 (+) Transcript_87005:71-706(+)